MNIKIKNKITRKYLNSFFTYFFVASGLFIIGTANAAVWLFDPTVTLEQEYDDNYRLATESSNEDEVWTTTLTGELAIKGKSERADLEALIRLDAVDYNGDDDDLDDRNNQFLALSSKYKLSERDSVSLAANLNRDSILRNGIIEIEPEDVVIDDDGVIQPDGDIDTVLVQQNVRRTRTNVRTNWQHRLSEKTSAGLGYAYRDESFSDDSGTGLVESERHSLSANITKKITEKDKITGRISSIYFRPDSDRDVDTLEARLKWIHDFSEAFQMDFSLGVRESDFDNAPKSSDTGFVANIGAKKRVGLTTYRFNLERRVRPSASGNEVESDEVTLSVKRRITETMNFRFAGRFFDTESTDDSNSRNNREFFTLSPVLSWRFSPSWVARASYEYRERDLDNGGSGDSNSAFFSISYSPPRQF